MTSRLKESRVVWKKKQFFFLHVLFPFRLEKVDIPRWKMPRPPWSCTSWLKLNGNSTWPRILQKTSNPGETHAVEQPTVLPASHLQKLEPLGEGLDQRLNTHWNFISAIVVTVCLSVSWKRRAFVLKPTSWSGRWPRPVIPDTWEAETGYRYKVCLAYRISSRPVKPCPIIKRARKKA